MSSNGQHSASSSGIRSSEAIATAMESINTLSVWLKDAGLDESAIAHWKFNALASKFPDLADIIEDAKKLISSGVPLLEVGMTVTEVASRLSEGKERKIKPAQVNTALVELGLQVRPSNGKRIWQLTEAGTEYGFSRLATSKTNDWSGPQVSWCESVIPLLIDYFEAADEEKLVGRQTQEVSSPSLSDLTTQEDSTLSTEPEPLPLSKSWMINERLKVLQKKVNSSQRLHIEMEAAEAYKQRHSKPPTKEQLKGKYVDIYPTNDLDLVDEAINRVLQRYK